MERWTVAEPFSGQTRYHINTSGQPKWCQFAYAVSPLVNTHDVVIKLAAGADSASVEWFPYIRGGMLRGLEWYREHGKEIVGLHIEIQKVDTHPVATTVKACETWGFMFIGSELVSRTIQLQDAPS